MDMVRSMVNNSLRTRMEHLEHNSNLQLHMAHSTGHKLVHSTERSMESSMVHKVGNSMILAFWCLNGCSSYSAVKIL